MKNNLCIISAQERFGVVSKYNKYCIGIGQNDKKKKSAYQIIAKIKYRASLFVTTMYQFFSQGTFSKCECAGQAIFFIY